MAWTQSQLDILDAHIARGVTRVDYGDRSVTYGSISDMLKLRGLMAADVAAASATPPVRRTLVSFSRR